MAKSIMIQGTMSNVGKSLITGGLCRILQQDGYSVAPFKSQNMALNSYITEDGLEMGRAQVMQAECAKIKPQVEMNPILLKPTNHHGSQVIFMGKAVDTMDTQAYAELKKSLKSQVQTIYNQLASKYDMIIIEGAGSPVELNLLKDDIANMGMAKLAKSPVILVGDISRGGVFAQLIGTKMLLPAEEQRYVKGVIVNKFSGNVSLFKPGIDILNERLGTPVLGVVPFTKLDIDDEDGLSDRLTNKNPTGVVDIVVIHLPKLSNFTDFNQFERIEGVTLRYVSSENELGNPDFIILPGTKNTMEDLLWMRENGLEKKIIAHGQKGKPIFGICGGYQMLCKTIHDPDCVEHGGSINGMGFFDAQTVFEQSKTTTQVTGRFNEASGIFKNLSHTTFKGYEVHMGATEITDGTTQLTNVSVGHTGEQKGEGMVKGNIYGTYVHGIFDNGQVVTTIVKAFFEEKNIPFHKPVEDWDVYKEKQYDLLANTIRQSLDLNVLYKIIHEGVAL